MRVVFVNRYFHPDLSATSQMLTDLAFHLARKGWDVGVVTSRQAYDDARARLPARERVGGVDVRRVWTTTFGRAVLPLRAIDYATFYLSAGLALGRERNAIVVALTDPPLISIVASLASRRLVNWVQDVFPEAATALGIRVPAFVKRLRDWSTRRALMNVVIAEGMAPRIGGATVVRHNWATSDLHPLPRDPQAPFTVAYSGNLGRAHEIETIARAIEGLPDVEFRIIGGGPGLEVLRALNRPNVTFAPSVAREDLNRSLNSADVHLVSLKPALEGLVLPSKLYGILAVGKGVVYIGSAQGDVGRLIRDEGCGLCVEPGKPDELVSAIRQLANRPGLREQLGRRGRELYEKRFSAAAALAHWEAILRELTDA